MAKSKLSLSAKCKAETKLFEYLGNPENPFITRAELSNNVLGYKNSNQLNVMFTAAELGVIEAKALELRKKCSARVRAKIYTSMTQQAIKGNVQAAHLVLDRFEGKVIDKVQIDADINSTVTTLTDEALDKQIDEMKGKLNE